MGVALDSQLHLLAEQGCIVLLPSPFNIGGQLKALLTLYLLFRVPDSFPALPLIPIINS